MNSDIIFIKELKVNAIIGIFDWERVKPQPLIFDIEMNTSIKKPALSDNIIDTVCYKTVVDDIIDFTKQSKYKLIETLAEDICQLILNKYNGVQEIRLTVNKPQAVAEALSVGLIIYRAR